MTSDNYDTLPELMSRAALELSLHDDRKRIAVLKRALAKMRRVDRPDEPEDQL